MNNGTVKWFNSDKGFDLLQVKMAMTYLLIFQQFKRMVLSH